jgi:hypothetical protein
VSSQPIAEEHAGAFSAPRIGDGEWTAASFDARRQIEKGHFDLILGIM